MAKNKMFSHVIPSKSTAFPRFIFLITFYLYQVFVHVGPTYGLTRSFSSVVAITSHLRIMSYRPI